MRATRTVWAWIVLAAMLSAGCTGGGQEPAAVDTPDSGSATPTDGVSSEDPAAAGPSPRATRSGRTAPERETTDPTDSPATEGRDEADAPTDGGPSEGPDAPLRASGTDDGMSGSAEASRGVVVVTLDGAGVRDVALIDTADRRVARVDVRGGGTVALPVARDGTYRLAVSAGGPWGLEARWHDRGRTSLPVEARGTGVGSTAVFAGGTAVSISLEVRRTEATVAVTTAEGTREILTVSDGVETVREELPPGPVVLTARGRGDAPWRVAAK